MRHINKAAKRRAILLVLSCLAIIVCAVLLMNLEAPPGAAYDEPVYKPVTEARAPVAPPAPVTPPVTPTPTAEPTPSASAQAPPVADAPAPPAPPTPPVPPANGTVGEADITSLATRDLLIPVAGVAASQLRDSYNDGRSEGRVHQALDIMAPKDTPVLAVADGKVAKLFESARGGIMLYQFDPAGLYVYYYGHLSRFADGLFDGKELKRGEVIGYVGDTGNAGAGNYHLHFGISKVTSPGKWSGGEPINPYPLLARK